MIDVQSSFHWIGASRYGRWLVAGELVIVRATPKKFDEVGRSVVIGTTRQAPALAGGLLYLRDERDIVCLDLRKL